MKASVIIIQGEGKGHFSQAMTFIRALGKDNPEIKRIFLGRNFFRKTPAYFSEELQDFAYPVHRFYSPNFIHTPDQKGILIFISLLINLLLGPLYLAEAIRIRHLARRDSAKNIINFYDPLGAMAFRWNSKKIERIHISHHFYLSHPDFIHPHGHEGSYFWMAYMNRFMVRAADRVIALSFRRAKTFGKIEVFPPLVDDRIREIDPVPKDGDLCYLLSPGFIAELTRYYENYPERTAVLFSDKHQVSDLPENMKILLSSRRGLISTFQQSSRIICTAGFDLVAEAFYLGLPVYLIPSENHYEQYCNALDAVRTGMAFQLDSLRELDEAELDPRSNEKYRKWVDSMKIGNLLKE